MQITLRPTLKQHQAWQKLLDSVTKYVFFGGGAGGGKSFLGCEWILHNCYRYPGSKWFIGREELKRLMASTYVTWLKVCSHHRVPASDWKLNGQYNYIEFANGSRVDLLDLKFLPSDPLYERFGSLEYTGGWIEEGGEIVFKAFDVLKSRIGRHRNDEYGLIGKILVTCNPKKNWLYQDVYKPWKEGTLGKLYAFIQSLYNDNPHTARSYGEDLAGIKDRATKERLMFGNWEYSDDPAILMTYDAICDLFTNALENESGEKAMTVDVARMGQDKTVIRLWRGLRNYRTLVFTKQDTEQTKLKIRELAVSERIPYSRIVIDEDGIGGGVVDGLRGVRGFVANSSPVETAPPSERRRDGYEKPNYKNLKAQCTFALAEAVNGHALAVSLDVQGQEPEEMRGELIQELEVIKRANPDSDEKKLAVESKEKVKELIGRSPDHADSLMMRMYLELKPKAAVTQDAVTNLVQPIYPHLPG